MSKSNISVLPSNLPAKRNTSDGVSERSGVKKNSLTRLRFKGTLAYTASRIGGKDNFFDLVRQSARENQWLMPLIEKWDSISKSDRRYICIDDLVSALDLSPGRVLGAVVETAFNDNLDVSRLIASVWHPQVVEASIEKALTPEGEADRRMLFQHSGFTPKSTGAVVNVQANANSQAVAGANADRGLPSFEDTVSEKDFYFEKVLDVEIREEKERMAYSIPESIEGHRILENEDKSMAEQSEESGEPEY